jgi:hypothetical protein
MIVNNLPSYLYQQYTEDPFNEDLQAFFTAYNNLSQTNLDNINNLNLPIYTLLSGALLDWSALGIYGSLRPALPVATVSSSLGVYNTVDYNTTAYSENIGSGGSSEYVVTDDIFKRILTWNFYKGDGFQYNTQWLKRRIKQFLYGVNGVPIDLDNTYEISVTYVIPNTININIPDLPITPIFISALASGALHVPFQYVYIVNGVTTDVDWVNNSSDVITWTNNSTVTIPWYKV